MNSESDSEPKGDSDSSNDEVLMTAYADKADTAAFSKLYLRYESKLYGFFFRRLSSDSRFLAADLFQKTWLKVHGARHQFDGHKMFAPWLFTIALNTLRDEWRIPKVIEPFEDLSDTEALPAQDNVEKDLSIKQDLIRLEKALSQIPENQREILLLSEWEGFSARELGEVFQISEVAARQMVSRAKKKVREIMKEEQT